MDTGVENSVWNQYQIENKWDTHIKDGHKVEEKSHTKDSQQSPRSQIQVVNGLGKQDHSGHKGDNEKDGNKENQDTVAMITECVPDPTNCDTLSLQIQATNMSGFDRRKYKKNKVNAGLKSMEALASIT